MLQVYENKLESVPLQDILADQKNFETVIKNVIDKPGLRGISFMPFTFDCEREVLKRFIENMPKFEKKIYHYFVSYCENNGLYQKLNEEYVSIKGYYVANENLTELELRSEAALTIYIELLPINNGRASLSLYRWEDKLNELRDGTSADGIQGAFNEGWSDIPF